MELKRRKQPMHTRGKFTSAIWIPLALILTMTGSLVCGSYCELNAASITPPQAECPMHSHGAPSGPPIDHVDPCPGCSDSTILPEGAVQIHANFVVLPFSDPFNTIERVSSAVIIRHSLDPATSPPLRLFRTLNVIRI